MSHSSQRLIFNASFPRAGGTLLQLLLSQNPQIFTPINSPLVELVHSLSVLFEGTFQSADNATSLPARAIKSSIASLVRGFYSFSDRPLVVDKAGTGALHYANILAGAVDGFKIIVCVRDPRCIIAALERDYRERRLAPFELPAVMMNRPLEERVDWWLSKGQLGLALSRWKQVLSNGPSSTYFILRYEDLCAAPHATLGLLHDFLSIEQFEYQPGNLPTPSSEICFHESTQVYGGALRAARSEFSEYLGNQIANQIVLSNLPFYSAIYPDVFAMDAAIVSKVPPEIK